MTEQQIEQAKSKIALMPRKEINAEVLHCWREQEQLASEIHELRTALKPIYERLHLYVHDYGITPDDPEWPMLEKARQILFPNGACWDEDAETFESGEFGGDGR